MCNVRDLRYFVSVAEELHFTRAAELLQISQPSLSRQIRVLERDLGFALFQRDRRAVALTPAGESLLPRARELLSSWDDALAESTERARAAAAVLRVGFQTSVAGPLYQVTVGRFREQHPGWTVELKLHPWSDPTAGLLEGKERRRLRLAAPARRGAARAANALDRGPPPGALVHASACRAAGAPDRRSVGRAVRRASTCRWVLRDYWLAVDERDGHPVRIGAEAETPDETFEAISAKQGVALLGAGPAQVYARPEIVTCPVIDVSNAEFAVAWRVGDERAVVQEFAEAAEEAISICATPVTAVTDAGDR
jgi:DNA-binding transcriptional LysR family regulator